MNFRRTAPGGQENGALPSEILGLVSPSGWITTDFLVSPSDEDSGFGLAKMIHSPVTNVGSGNYMRAFFLFLNELPSDGLVLRRRFRVWTHAINVR